MSDHLDYVIKLVYPEWVVDPHRHQRIGFSEKHRHQVAAWPVGGKMLVYLTDQQLLIAAVEVAGTLEQGTALNLMSHPRYPLHLPVRMLHDGKAALSLRDIQRVTPSFQPSKDMSYWPIPKDDFDRLLQQLRSAR